VTHLAPPLTVAASLFALAGALADSTWFLSLAILVLAAAVANEAIRLERIRETVESIDEVLADVDAYLDEHKQ